MRTQEVIHAEIQDEMAVSYREQAIVSNMVSATRAIDAIMELDCVGGEVCKEVLAIKNKMLDAFAATLREHGIDLGDEYTNPDDDLTDLNADPI